MKTAGIIAEYNPFHGGHLYQLHQVRERFHADFVVVVMSGDFVQRGEPAIYDKYIRTQIALEAGADLILELPVCFATSSAEDFASAATALLDRLGIVDDLCFGSELGETAPLLKAARLLISEPEEYKSRLQEYLKSGASFPKARAQALAAFLSPMTEKDSSLSFPETLLSSPNNILGIEYLKALLRRNSRITPLTVKRKGQDYHDTTLSADAAWPSASALRHGIHDGLVDYFQELPRICAVSDGRNAGHFTRFLSKLPQSDHDSQTPVFADDLSQIFNWKLLELLQSGRSLTGFSGLSQELAARLTRTALDFDTFTGRILQLKTRQYTYTRISRALLHLLLDITDADISLAKSMDYVPYVRILGFRRSAKELLTKIRQSCPLPLITKTADARQLLDNDSLKIFQKDLYASHLRQTLVYHKSGRRHPNEYTRSVIIRPD